MACKCKGILLDAIFMYSVAWIEVLVVYVQKRTQKCTFWSCLPLTECVLLQHPTNFVLHLNLSLSFVVNCGLTFLCFLVRYTVTVLSLWGNECPECRAVALKRNCSRSVQVVHISLAFNSPDYYHATDVHELLLVIAIENAITLCIIISWTATEHSQSCWQHDRKVVEIALYIADWCSW